MVINIGTNLTNLISFRGNTTHKNPISPSEKCSVKFASSKLNILDSDTVSISETSIKRCEIHKLVRQFSDLIRNLANNNNINPLNIKKIAERIAPNCDIDIKDIKSNPKYADRIAVCDTDYLNGSAHSILYINFDVASERIIQNATHEFTHALQDNTPEERIISDRCRRYGGVSKMSNAFVEFEKGFLDINFFNDVAQRSDTILDKLNNSKDEKPLKTFSFNEEKHCTKYDALLAKIMNDHEITNERFACEFFKAQVLDESEAYKEGFMTKKELANIPQNQYIIQDLLPKMYDDLIEYFDRKISRTK